MDTLPQDFIDFVRDLQRYANYEVHSYKLAKALGMRFRLGLTNYAIPAAKPGPVIVLSPWYFGGNNDVTRHEIGHVMLYWSGLERLIIQEYGIEDGMRMIERLCQQAVAFLRIPQPIVDQAVKRYGVSAQAVAALMRATGAPHQMALDRLIYDKPADERGGFITSGKYIAGVAACNVRLPFWIFDRVPEVRQVVPNASLIRLPGGAGVLGVLYGRRVDDWYWEGA